MRLLLAACLVGCRTSQPMPPDVLLVVLDTVRADRLGAYGADRPTSQQLSAIADAGVLFSDVTAPGTWTWPSHAALFTGEPPWETGAHWATGPAAVDETTGYWRMAQMRSDLPTIAERFTEAGYRTVALSSNSLLDPQLGLTRGFERAEWLERDQLVVEAAQAEMAGNGERPLFLFVNLMAAHAPYTVAPEVPWSAQHALRMAAAEPTEWLKVYGAERTPPALALSQRPAPGELTGEEAFASGALELSPADLELVADLYDGELIRLDKALVTLVEAWNRSGLGAGVVAVTSDHGEYLGEHGLIGHGIRAFTQVTRVPLVLAAPGRIDAGQRVDTPVQLQDIAPTLLDVAGLEPGAKGSLLPVIRGEPRPGPILARAWPMPVFSKNVGGPYAWGHRLVREGDRAVLVRDDGQVQSFSMRDDPNMTSPLQEDLSGWVDRAALLMPDRAENKALDIPADALQHLRALGYVE